MTHFGGLQKDVWPLPPRGITTSRTNHRAGVLVQYTYLCETDGCFAISFSQDSELHARQQLDGHACPQEEGSRGLIPTGKTLVQKMWDEADDAMDAYLQIDVYGVTPEYKGMSGEKLQGYIRGIAEVLTFCTVPCFKVTKDVLRELNRRWKMRNGQIQFAPTPSYSYNPHLDVVRSKAMADEVKTAKPAKAARASISKVAKPVTEEKQLTSAERDVIRASYHQGTFTADKIAELYGITAERVVRIAGPKPTADSKPEIGFVHIF